MRVLLTAAPSIGHIAPMLGVAVALRDAGHEVRLATHPSGHDVATRAGLDVAAAGMSEAEMLAERRRRWPETERQPPSAWAVRMFTQILAPTMAADLLAIVGDWRPKLIIHEEGEYAGPAVAARTGVPCVTHGWGSPLRPDGDLVTLEGDAAPLWESLGVDMAPAAGLYRDGLLNPCPAFLQPDAPGAPAAWPLRPTTLQEPPGARASEEDWDTDLGLAYVGFGTVAHFADAPAEIRAAVGAVVGRGLTAVVTTTDPNLGAELEEVHSDRVRVRPFVSLPELLARCRIVVSHAGAGTVLASLAAGVPLVLMPRGAPSQLRMATACANAGIARIAAIGDVAKAVAAMLDDEDMPRRLRRAAADIAAMPSPADVVPTLEAIVEAGT